MKSTIAFLIFELVLFLSFTKGQSLPVLQPSLEEAPDVTEKARQRYEAAAAVLHRMKAEKLKEEDLSETERRQYYDFYETYMGTGYFPEGFLGLIPYYLTGCSVKPDSVWASSTLPNQGRNSYEAGNLTDLNLETAWVEGDSDQGIGTVITYHFDRYQPYDPNIQVPIPFAVHNGYHKSLRAWHQNGRVKEMKLSVNGEELAILALKDVRNLQQFDLSELAQAFPESPTFSFEILSVYPGDRYQDVVISEMNFGIGPCQCVANGTEVSLPNGKRRAIEDLSIGDTVLGLDPRTGNIGPARILAMHHPEHEVLAELRFDDGSWLLITPDHPIWTVDKGWKAIQPAFSRGYITNSNIRKLVIGDRLAGVAGNPRLVSIEIITQSQKTHTITRLSGRYAAFLAGGVWISSGSNQQETTETHGSE